jgi:hypothetical protein
LASYLLDTDALLVESKELAEVPKLLHARQACLDSPNTVLDELEHSLGPSVNEFDELG